VAYSQIGRVRRRTGSVVAGIVAAFAITALVVGMNEPDGSSGIIVPALGTTSPSISTATVVDVVAAQPNTTTSTVSSRQQPSSTAVRPAPKPTVTTTAVPVPPGPATKTQATSRFDPWAHVRVVNVVNSLALDGTGNKSTGSAMKLWTQNPSPNQQFQLRETGDGYYCLVNRATGLLVDGRGAASAGTWVGQWGWSASPNVQWSITEYGDGMFTVKNRATGMVLDGGGAGVTSGSPAKQWPDNGSRNLLWRFVVA
jgi:hypothetical protein